MEHSFLVGVVACNGMVGKVGGGAGVVGAVEVVSLKTSFCIAILL